MGERYRRSAHAAAAEITVADLIHATSWPRPFTEDGWVFENKLDGFRCLVRKAGDTQMLSRRGRSMVDQFPEVVEAITRHLPDCVIDAELVVLDASGNTRWERVRRRAVMRQTLSIAVAAEQQPAVLGVRPFVA